MATYSLQAFSSLARASLVSRQVSDLVSSAPFLMNATSPYRVSSESRAVVAQVDGLLLAMEPRKDDDFIRGFSNRHILDLLLEIRSQTLALAADAEAAQARKADAAAALGEIATGRNIADLELRRRLNTIVQSASNSDSLFQLGELKRRYVSETALFKSLVDAGPSLPLAELQPYERVFQAQTEYLLKCSRSGVRWRVCIPFPETCHTQLKCRRKAVAKGLNEGLTSASNALTVFWSWWHSPRCWC